MWTCPTQAKTHYLITVKVDRVRLFLCFVFAATDPVVGNGTTNRKGKSRRKGFLTQISCWRLTIKLFDLFTYPFFFPFAFAFLSFPFKRQRLITHTQQNSAHTLTQSYSILSHLFSIHVSVNLSFLGKTLSVYKHVFFSSSNFLLVRPKLSNGTIQLNKIRQQRGGPGTSTDNLSATHLHHR